jgi:hypothetical protein
LSIFNESLRNKRTSWRPLGYIYDMAQHGGKHPMVTTDRKRPRKLKPVEKFSRHHKILQKLLESHITIQRAGGIEDIPIELGTVRKRVNVNVPVGLILDDM